MSTVLPTDKVLVQRATTLHSAPADMSTVQDTDLLLINRAGVDYKCSVADWKASQSKPPAIASVTLADSPEAGRFTSGTFRSTVVMTDEGIPASTKGIKAYVQGVLKTQAKSSAIATVGTVTAEVYSSYFTCPVGVYNMTTTFDNSTTTGEGIDNAASSTTAAQRTLTFAPPTPINIGKSFRVYNSGGSTVNQVWTLDGATHTIPGGTPAGWTDFPEFVGKSISATTPLTIVGNGSQATRIGNAWEVDGTMLVDGASLTKLTLTDSTDLAKFTAGDAITEVTAAGAAGDATGTVGAVDATAKTIVLSATAGTWDVGSAVKGPLKTSVVTTTPQSDEIVAVGGTAAAPVLTFKTAKDLANFAAGDAIKQENTAVGLSHVEVRRKAGTAVNAVVRGYVINGVQLQDGGGKNYTSGFSGSPSLSGGGPFAGTAPANYAEGASIVWDASLFFAAADIKSFVLKISSGGTSGGTYEVLVNGAVVGELIFTDGNTYSKDITAFLVQAGAIGTVGSVNTTALTMALATSTGTWGPANAGHYVIGPTKTGPAANVKLFCKLNPTLTVTDLQSADPGYTAVTGAGPYTVTFPATLPTGAAPDVDLPAGTSLTTEVQAVNASATVTKTSNTVVPT